jgi:hypothetical protein
MRISLHVLRKIVTNGARLTTGLYFFTLGMKGGLDI